MKSLYILDLDHTLIYGSYAISEEANLLFKYSKYLKVYERPNAREFIDYINNINGDVIVYTTAKEVYALQICLLLKIKTTNILTRKNCISKNDKYYKDLLPEWGMIYETIFIIDDSPNIWMNIENFKSKIKFIVPKEFRGESKDRELLKLLLELKTCY